MGFGSLFRNYFYGRPGQKDYTEKDMPETRMQLFREVLRARFTSLFSLNFLYILIWIPAVIWTYINIVQFNYMLEADPAQLAPGWAGDLLFSYLLVLAPLTAITGPFTCAASHVTRNWARDEHSFVFIDFKQALKENFRRGLLYGCLSGVAPLAVYLCIDLYGQLVNTSPLFYLPMALIFITAVLWALASMLVHYLEMGYRLSFGHVIKNALLMTISELPLAIAVRLATYLVPIVLLAAFLFFPGALNFLVPAALCLYALFMPAFNRLITASYANALCEKHLNAGIEGAETNIGLRKR